MRCSADVSSRLVALLFALSVAAVACDDENTPIEPDATAAPAPEVAPSIASAACTPNPALSWESFGAGFVRNYCTGCHSSHLEAGARTDAPVGVDLDTLERVRGLSDRALLRATGPDASMPPGGGPGEEERALFRQWLECGAPTLDDVTR